MAFCEVKFSGQSIGKHTSMDVIVPNSGSGPFPVLYLLHGLSDDCTRWRRQTSIERYVEDLPLIVVMPDGGRSFYVNDPRPGGRAYEDHIVKDVVGFVDRVFPTIAAARGRAVAGLSMGGYGAMMLALKHPDLFCAGAAHSGAFLFAHEKRQWVQGKEDVTFLNQAVRPKDYDVFRLAAACKTRRRRPALRFDCGLDDWLLASNRAFHTHLDKLGLAHEYAEHPGGHSWDYWDIHIRETLAFVRKAMKKP